MNNKKIDSEIEQLKKMSQAKHKYKKSFLVWFLPAITLFIILICMCLTTPYYMYCNKDINTCSIYRHNKVITFPITKIKEAYFQQSYAHREKNMLFIIFKNRQKNNLFGFEKNPNFLEIFPRFNIVLVNDKYHVKDSVKKINTYINSTQKEIYIKEKLCLKFSSSIILLFCITFYVWLGLKNFSNITIYINRKLSYLLYKITSVFKKHPKDKSRR